VDVLRAESAEELQQLVGLLTEYERSLEPDLRHGSEPDLEEVRTAYAEPNAAFIAVTENAAAGCVAVRRRDAETAVLQRMYVRPAYRNLGMARALVSAVIEFARERDYHRVVLDTHRDRLPAAYKLYLAMGFTESHAYDSVDYECPTFMELRLR
jgi:putative acetyltransferase